jgi:hypothetical protein
VIDEGIQRPVQPTRGRWWKLPLTFVALLSTTAGALGCLIAVAATKQELLVILSVPAQRSWLIATLGGAVGGLARALYSFLLDNYAFHYRHITGRSSPYVKEAYGIDDDKKMEDDFDPLESWHLYFIKPLVGATLGLLFALAADLGLISLGGEIVDEGKHSMRLVVTAGMAGLFAENVLHRLQGFLMKPLKDSSAA